jgi:hypothetical protein
MGTIGDGSFHLQGTAQGACAGIRPDYFRVDMNDAHFPRILLVVTSYGRAKEVHRLHCC